MVTLPQPCGPSALWTWSWAVPDGNVAVEELGGFFTALVPFKSRAVCHQWEILPWPSTATRSCYHHAWDPGCEVDPG